MTTKFVPAGRDPQTTATLLIGTAQEFGFDVRVVKATRGGFVIPSALHEVVYAAVDRNKVKTVAEVKVEAEAKTEPKKTTTKKTSGAKAAKTAITDKE